MGKFKDAVNTGGLKVGNTVATPFRIVGEAGNAVANIPRQWFSGVKNIAEVSKQTRDALIDNFLNFSKVEGKWINKLFKRAVNLTSAVTRRPFMIAWAGLWSMTNQWVLQPLKKLLYTPGKMFKWMRNAMRPLSKEKGFDFVKYETADTKWDTLVNQIKEKNSGFIGVKWWSSEKPAEEKKPVEDKKVEDKKVEPKQPDQSSDKKTDSTPPSTSSSDKPKSIDEVKEKDKKETEKKIKEEQDNNFPEWKTLPEEYKKHYIKDYNKVLKDNPTKAWIIALGKEGKISENPEEIINVYKDTDRTFAGYMEEILNKAA